MTRDGAFNTELAIMRGIKGIGLSWGVVSFAIGIVSSFTLNSVHIVESVIVLLCGFLIVLPLSVFAVWRPRTAAL